MNYFFIFGNTPELSKLELDTIYTGGNPLDIADLLGGTVKIAEKIGSVSKISDYLVSLNLPKIDFGISSRPDLSKRVKKDLEEKGIKARFVLPRDGKDLSSVVVKKQKLIEIIVQGEEFGRTIWVQDFEEWNRRDYGRPSVDPHIGMLPPKIARMMTNIAVGNKSHAILLDPFCGTGTILTEGLMVNKKVIGSDLNEKQVIRTNENLKWLGKGVGTVFVSDARSVSQNIHLTVDAVVTEPDLGPNLNKSSNQGNPQLLRKLGFLYVDCLREWKKILKKGGRVVMVIPSTNISKDNQIDLVKMTVDNAISMGYSEFHKPIEYSRQQAVVKRNIIFLVS